MTTILRFSLCVFLGTIPAIGSAQGTLRTKPGTGGNLSLKLEIERAVDRGLKWLAEQQDPETGGWSDPNHPALTALPVAAFVGNPFREPGSPLPAPAEKGYEFLLTKVKADGGIYGKGLATYNTSLAIMALAQSGKPEHLPVIARARRLLINQQQDFDQRGETDNLFDGGIGYGGSYAHSDLSNTHLAMEALAFSRQVLADTEFDESDEFDLDWDAAIDFVSRCQNSKGTIDKLGDWAGLRPDDEGGFVYFPGNTKSDEIELPDGTVALRSYGSMSYAGLLSFIYAEMDESDPRVQGALHWLSRNYSVEENPGLGAQGLFYYYHTMAKALTMARIQKLELANGRKIDWRVKLTVELIDHQQRDGSWVNQASNRWWEDDPVLVTSYALLALQHIARGL